MMSYKKIIIILLLLLAVGYIIYKLITNKEYFYRKSRNPGYGPSDSQIAKNKAAYAEQQRQESLKTQQQKDAEKASRDARDNILRSEISSGLANHDKIMEETLKSLKLTESAAWLKAFIVQNDAAKKYGNRLKVTNERHLYLDDKDLGYSDDFPNHVGYLRGSSGYFVPIEAIFTLIAGPDSKEECFEHFDFLGIGGALTSAYDWTKDRVNDAANFAKNAVNSIGDWAKNLSSEVLDWCKNAGQSFATSLIDFGTKIGCVARKIAREIANTVVNTLNTIKDFFVDLAKKAKEAFESGFNWIKNNINLFWDKIQPILGTIINIILEGSACEYSINRNISKLEAVKVIEPVITPKVRVIFLELIKKGIETVSAGILLPFIELLMPIIENFTDIDSKIDSLLSTLLEKDFAVQSITTLADNSVAPLVSKYCSSFSEPNIDDITINESSADSISSNTEWL